MVYERCGEEGVCLFVKVRRLKVSMQYKETQRNHENKKREKEFERLKQKLGQVLALIIEQCEGRTLHLPYSLPPNVDTLKSRLAGHLI